MRRGCTNDRCEPGAVSPPVVPPLPTLSLPQFPDTRYPLPLTISTPSLFLEHPVQEKGRSSYKETRRGYTERKLGN